MSSPAPAYNDPNYKFRALGGVALAGFGFVTVMFIVGTSRSVNAGAIVSLFAMAFILAMNILLIVLRPPSNATGNTSRFSMDNPGTAIVVNIATGAVTALLSAWITANWASWTQ